MKKDKIPEERTYVIQYIESMIVESVDSPVTEMGEKYDDDGRCSTLTINPDEFWLKIRDSEPVRFDIRRVACIKQNPIRKSLLSFIVSSTGATLEAHRIDCHLADDLVNFSKVSFQRALKRL